MSKPEFITACLAGVMSFVTAFSVIGYCGIAGTETVSAAVSEKEETVVIAANENEKLGAAVTTLLSEDSSDEIDVAPDTSDDEQLQELLGESIAQLTAGSSKSAQETVEEKKEKEEQEKKEAQKAKEKEEEESGPVYIGTFKVTAYCSCSKCCGSSSGITASGTRATAGRTIAADTSRFPFGTKLTFNGNTYVVEDTGGAISGNRIDIYMGSHSAALSWGVRYCEVYMETE